MNLEQEIQRYIQNNDWNINYEGTTAKNIFGTEYTVSFADTKHYFDFSSVRIFSKKITLKAPCTFHKDIINIEDDTNYIAQRLAHEIGHTETYGLSTALTLALLTMSIKKSITHKNFKYLVTGGLTCAAVKFFSDELLAEATAYLIHGASLETNGSPLYKSILDLF